MSTGSGLRSLFLWLFERLDYFHALGQLNNNGNTVANISAIIATFYNSTGGVVAVQPGFPSPNDISASQSGSFEIITNSSASIVSYTLQAEANTLSLISPVYLSGEYNYTI